MLRRTVVSPLRVLCLTMLPDGGALTPALRTLGYTPYTLRSTYQQGHASTHPMAWSALLDGTTNALPPGVLADYDALVGPPGAMVYDVLLRQAPAYTKVILVEEADKEGWARSYDAYMQRLQVSTKRASNNRITRAFQNMIAKMVVGADSTPPSTPDKARRRTTSSSGDLRRAFAAEAANLQRGTRGSSTPSSPLPSVHRATTSPEHDTVAGQTESDADDGQLRHPRAIALQLFEESVKVSIPPSALLVYRHGDGWEPLCDFLEKPVPASPFPDYDDGLRVLGNLQERIDRAHTLQYFFGGLCLVCIVVTVLPWCSSATRVVKELYTDYQVAFGADGDAAAKTVDDGSGGSGAQTEADRFDAAWQKRGGTVTRTRHE